MDDVGKDEDGVRLEDVFEKAGEAVGKAGEAAGKAVGGGERRLSGVGARMVALRLAGCSSSFTVSMYTLKLCRVNSFLHHRMMDWAIEICTCITGI